MSTVKRIHVYQNHIVAFAAARWKKTDEVSILNLGIYTFDSRFSDAYLMQGRKSKRNMNYEKN